MSGGGSSDKKKSTTPATPAVTPTTPYANAPTAQTLQPMMPGFQNMLAEQLGAGFGGSAGAPDFAAMLSSMYSPMSMINFKEPISQTKANYDKKKFAPISTGNPTLDKLLMGTGSSSSSSSSSKPKAGQRLEVGQLDGFTVSGARGR